MNTKFERLLFSLSTDPPKGSRAEALRLRELFAALPPEEQAERRRVHGKYPYVKEAQAYLPHLNVTRTTAYEVLLNNEKKGWAVSAAWTYLDRKLPESVVKIAVNKAKRGHLRSRLDYGDFLKSRLEQEWKRRQPGARKRRKKRPHKRASRRRNPQGVQPSPRQPQPQESPTVNKTDLNLAIQGPRRHLISLAAATRSLTEEDWVHLAIDRLAEADTGLAPARPLQRPPVKPRPESRRKAAAPAAKEPDEMPRLHERLRMVIGTKQVDIREAVYLLRARDKRWCPESRHANAYVSIAMSSHPEIFKRVSRGVYRLRRPTEQQKVPAKPPTSTAATPNGQGPVNEGSSNVVENPFAPN